MSESDKALIESKLKVFKAAKKILSQSTVDKVALCSAITDLEVADSELKPFNDASGTDGTRLRKLRAKILRLIDRLKLKRDGTPEDKDLRPPDLGLGR